MAKTLVIKGADFSTNKLDTVVFGEIPCTGITMDATGTIKGLSNTLSLVPVLTPANTTDQVTWESSDTNVATVSGGMVTSHRYGTTKITAQCGEYSASCVITVSIDILYAVGGSTIITCTAHDLKDGILGGIESTSYIAIGSKQMGNMYPVCEKYDAGDIAALYPIQIPDGAKTITVTISNFACVITYMNGNVKSNEAFQEKIRDGAKVLDGETPNGSTDWSISGWTYDERTLTIPDIEGINSFVLTLRAKNATAFSNFDINNLSITFGYEAVA